MIEYMNTLAAYDCVSIVCVCSSIFIPPIASVCMKSIDGGASFGHPGFQMDVGSQVVYEIHCLGTSFGHPGFQMDVGSQIVYGTRCLGAFSGHLSFQMDLGNQIAYKIQKANF